jgi:hypothetical protein
MNLNSKLSKAKKNKNDEFYTKLIYIENELKHYKHHFENKVVFCNCDDPEWSNFYIFFKSKLNEYKIKKLIFTHYKDNNLYDQLYKLECITIVNNNGLIIENKTYLKDNGDFRSEECIELLKQSDIVCTNPPFSLFREYMDQLNKYNKEFLIIGNMNSIACKDIFNLVKDNKLWLGVSPRGMFFKTKDGGDKEVNAAWFTNLTHNKKNEDIYLNAKYSTETYSNYDNHTAIEVSKTKNIPCDYKGIMGVPLTFLDRYNPEQFEIVGLKKGLDGKDLRLNNKVLYTRILIKNIKI